MGGVCKFTSPVPAPPYVMYRLPSFHGPARANLSPVASWSPPETSENVLSTGGEGKPPDVMLYRLPEFSETPVDPLKPPLAMSLLPSRLTEWHVVQEPLGWTAKVGVSAPGAIAQDRSRSSALGRAVRVVKDGSFELPVDEMDRPHRLVLEHSPAAARPALHDEGRVVSSRGLLETLPRRLQDVDLRIRSRFGNDGRVVERRRRFGGPRGIAERELDGAVRAGPRRDRVFAHDHRRWQRERQVRIRVGVQPRRRARRGSRQ